MVRRTKQLIICCIAALALPLMAIAQDAQQVKSDPNLIYGEGFGKSKEAADQAALQDLMTKISIKVVGDITVKEEELNENREIKSKSSTEAVIRTYTSGTLTNTKSITVTQGPEWDVIRYMEVAEVEKIFEARKDMIDDYVRQAMTAEEKGRIDNALRYYYWAFCLLKSLQHPEKVDFTDRDGQKHLLKTWIPEQMDDIFTNLATEVASMEDNTIDLLIKYKEKPVTSIDFHYNNGVGDSPAVWAKNGMATIEMAPGWNLNNILIDYEYKYLNRTQQDREGLGMVVDLFKDTDFPKSHEAVSVKGKREQKAARAQLQAAVEEVSTATNAVEVTSTSKYDKSIKQLMDAIVGRKYDSCKDLFTTEGYKMFNALISYGNARLLGHADVKYYECPDGRTVCRSIPMSFTFKNNHVTFTEDVTLTFNADGKIESLAFALDNDTRNAVLNDTRKKWDEGVPVAITNFIENYKTAFALKDLDYIKGIFDNDAVIVTGHVVTRTAPKKGEISQKGEQTVQYNRHNKQEYMERLAQQFRKNQFINLRLTDVDARITGKEHVYALRIKQDYFSSNYADTGYLFLLIKMEDPTKPLIFVRTWQPNRDPSVGTALPKSDPLYGLVYEGFFF